MSANLDGLIDSALKLNSEVRNGNLTPAHNMLSNEIARLQGEVDLDALLPGSGGSLGLAAEKRDADSFLCLFNRRIRANLCAKNGEFSKLIGQGIQSSVAATLTALVVSLGLPAVALPLLIPIAVILCNSGLEAFCEQSDPVPNS